MIFEMHVCLNLRFILIYTIGVVQCDLWPVYEIQCHGLWTELPLHWMKNNKSFIGINIMFTQQVPGGKVNAIIFPRSCHFKK